MKQNTPFLQPIISVFGLAVSLITSILPLFRKEPISNLFVADSFVQAVSFLAFILSIALIWQIVQFHPFININIGKLKDRGHGFNEARFSINQSKLIWILMTTCILFAFVFLGFKFLFVPDKLLNLLSLVQSFFYLTFFLSLTSIFAILFSTTKNMFDYKEEQEQFPFTVAETLSRHNIVKTGVEISENKMIDNNELTSHGLLGVVIARKLKVKTPNQAEQEIEVIMDNKGQQVLKVLNKTTSTNSK